MSKRQQTEVTWEVRLLLPVGSNVAMASEYISSAIKSYADPMFNVDRTSIVVKLKRKVQNYA